MGRLVPLPPWATKEEIEKRLRYYRNLSYLMFGCVLGTCIFLIVAAVLTFKPLIFH
jgi:hypothetical protein